MMEYISPFISFYRVDIPALLTRYSEWYDLELLALRAGEAERQRKRAARNMKRYGLKPAA